MLRPPLPWNQFIYPSNHNFLHHGIQDTHDETLYYIQYCATLVCQLFLSTKRYSTPAVCQAIVIVPELCDVPFMGRSERAEI